MSTSYVRAPVVSLGQRVWSCVENEGGDEGVELGQWRHGELWGWAGQAHS